MCNESTLFNVVYNFFYSVKQKCKNKYGINTEKSRPIECLQLFRYVGSGRECEKNQLSL